MSVITALLLMCALVAVLMLLCAVIIRIEKKHPGEDYDERQKQARGNAYRFSFWLGFVYYFVLYIALLWYFPKDLRPGNVAPAMFFGSILQVISFHIYCVFTHAALPLSENPLMPIWSYTVIGAFNLLELVVDGVRELSILEPGVNNLSRLMTGFFFLVMALMHLIQLIRNRKGEE